MLMNKVLCESRDRFDEATTKRGWSALSKSSPVRPDALNHTGEGRSDVIRVGRQGPSGGVDASKWGRGPDKIRSAQ
jgi:hypothetical protein